MAGSSRRTLTAYAVIAIAASWCAAAISGCYTTRYDRVLAGNVSLLCDLADKLQDYCRAGFKADGRQISSEEMGEFYYALKKAKSYGAMSSAESSQRSHQEFEQLLSAYTAFLHAADEYRLSGQADAGGLAKLAAMHEKVEQRGRATLASLRAEQH